MLKEEKKIWIAQGADPYVCYPSYRRYLLFYGKRAGI